MHPDNCPLPHGEGFLFWKQSTRVCEWGRQRSTLDRHQFEGSHYLYPAVERGLEQYSLAGQGEVNVLTALKNN